ncbi:hypothetical protein NEDG_00333 [Nematocida displodere]|uniref:Sm domain-containing protein n=1 Tax=Nematocida displodere TaxID=1805483 RepID=A0A177EJ13_9MICR|nr:hypothetical protein NEDG_00333 [Nematocida displodere]
MSPIEVLFEQMKEGREVSVELLDGTVLTGSILGLDEHINLVLGDGETETLVYAKSLVSVTAS